MSRFIVLDGLQCASFGRACRFEPVVGSTNDQLRHWAEAGAPHGAVCVAEEQTAGRGRHGRRWSSEPGQGLFASILVRPGVAVTSVPAFSPVVALVVAQAMERLGRVDTLVKWPNDVWIGRRKLGGILLEGFGDLDPVVVIGVGINLTTPRAGWPLELRGRAISMAEAREGVSLDARRVLVEILNRLEPAYERCLREGFAPFREDFHARSVLVGETVEVHADGPPFLAAVEGVDEEGRLAVLLSDGTQRNLLAGEVHLIPSSPR